MRNSFDTTDAQLTFSSQAGEISFLSDGDIMSVPQFKQLIEYLASKAPDGSLPCRKDVRPTDIKNLLPDFFMFDVVRKETLLTDLKVRLLGTKISRYYGNHTGESVHAFENKAAVQRIFACVTECIDKRDNVAVEVSGRSLQRDNVKINVLYCPLSDQDSVITQIIGVLIAKT
ncbi:MAG: hypothetical protein COB37_01560 [Kordiimonadales bacterium]|nr:MAG: hypothetical protein COB37_01560 [Kordiimonadales bacterium]